MDLLFVSSTFQDMQYERDAIRDLVMPRLNKEAHEYGQSVSVCDLRWGINTAKLDADTAALKVLDVCLDEIENSKPPMIVILGERYGWIPPDGLINSVAGRKELQLEDGQLSATALEIEYGVQIHKNQMLFYFRELEGAVVERKYLAEDEECHKKMTDLKSKIMHMSHGKVHKYLVHVDGGGICKEDIRRFADMVYEDVRQMMLPKWKDLPKNTPFARERESHWAYIKEKSRLFLAREAQADGIVDAVLEGQRRIVIKGESGSGKSALFCKVADMLKERGWCVIPFIGGLTADSATSMGILRQLVYALEEQLGQEHRNAAAGREWKPVDFHGTRRLQERLLELCLLFQDGDRPLVIMVDAVDQLLADTDRDQMIFLPDQMPSKVSIILSGLPDREWGKWKNIFLLPINREEKKAVIQCILQHHHKELADEVKEHLMDHPGSGNPLFLSYLLQRLLIMNRMDFGVISQMGSGIGQIADYQKKIIDHAQGSLEEIGVTLFKEVGVRLNPRLVSRVMEYTALSRYGLRDSDFALLLGEEWNYLDFVYLIHYLGESFFCREDGRYDFVHQRIRRGVMRECPNKKRIHNDIFQALEKLDEKDPIRVSEMAYHCIMAGHSGYLLDYIAKSQEEDSILKGAAKCIHGICKTDDGKWLRDLLASTGANFTAVSFAAFFVSFCAELFSQNDQESRIKFGIMKQLDLLIGHYQGERNMAWQKLLLANSYECACAAKFLGDPSVFEYGEKYFAISKDFYQKGMIDKRQLLMVYNNMVVFYKQSSKRSLLRRGMEIAKEGLHTGLGGLLSSGEDIPVWYYGSMGEIYHRLKEPENALKAYEQDLENRKLWAEKYPSAYSRCVLGGGYYNVGNALMMLGKFEAALPYYQTSLKLLEYRDGLLSEKVLRHERMREEIDLYNNYAEALWEAGREGRKKDYVSQAFFYKRKTLELDRYYWRFTNMEYHYERDMVKLARIINYLSEIDSSLAETCMKDFFHLVDFFLADGDGAYKTDHSLDNMWMLRDEYKAVFHAVQELCLADDILLSQYVHRCYHALIMPLDEGMTQEESNQDHSWQLNAAINDYNKSALLYDLDEPFFAGEALEASQKAEQELKKLMEKDGYEETVLAKQMAVCAYQTGRCYVRIKDRQNALRYFREAIEMQTQIVAATPDPKQKEILEEFKKGYRNCKDVVVRWEGNKALSDSLLAANMREVFDKKLKEQMKGALEGCCGEKKDGCMHGQGTKNYPDGSEYTGQWINGKRDGVGKLTWMSGKGTYYGQWKEDLKNGYGEAVFPNGGSYRGEWREGKIHGYGIKTNAKGEESCGVWQEGNLQKKLSKVIVAFALRKYGKRPVWAKDEPDRKKQKGEGGQNDREPQDKK